MISIRGDADPLVPYARSVRLQDALKHAGVAHEPITIPGGGHGGFSPDQRQRAYATIQAFVAAHVPTGRSSSGAGRQSPAHFLSGLRSMRSGYVVEGNCR